MKDFFKGAFKIIKFSKCWFYCSVLGTFVHPGIFLLTGFYKRTTLKAHASGLERWLFPDLWPSLELSLHQNLRKVFGGLLDDGGGINRSLLGLFVWDRLLQNHNMSV